MTRFANFSAVLILLATATTAVAEADIAKGERAFRKCASCHSLDPEFPKRPGPGLYGIVGRPVASLEGFEFSEAMKAGGEAGDIWDEARLTDFLGDPKSLYKGHKMAFAGIKRESELVDLIGYLKTQGPADQAPAAAEDTTAPAEGTAAPTQAAPAQ